MTDKEKDEYTISPMHRHLKEVVWYQLTREQTAEGRESGKVHRMKWLFRQKDFPCGACKGIDKTKFMVLPTGVFRSCEAEGFTEKIDPIDEGEMHSEATLLEDVILTDNADAIAVIKRYHQEKIFLDEESHINLPPYKLPKSVGKR